MKYTKIYTGVLLAISSIGSVHAGEDVKFDKVPASAAHQAQDAATTGSVVHLPGVSRAIMPPVTTETSEKAIWSRKLGKLNPGVKSLSSERTVTATTARISGDVSAARVAGDNSATAPASIPDLARALRNDPDLIYEYVRNNIEYVPMWGSSKGAMGALLDNQGTAFDQAALMIALLRQSGYTATFVKGRINLSATQVRDWLGVPTTNICGVLNLLANAQIPYTEAYATASGTCPGLSKVKVDHVWVKVNIGGTFYYFDPSFKAHTIKSGVNLTTATGYNASSFMSSATTGSTITTDYAQGINRTNVRNSLTSYATNLANYLKTNLPSATLDDVIGGMTIVPHTGAALRQATLPYQDTAVALTEWTDVPDNYKPTLRIQHAGIDATFTSDAVYGKRLTITYNAANQPVLSLDGTAIATGTAVAAGSNNLINFTVVHGAYASRHADQAFTQQIKAGGTFVISNGWGPAGRGTQELHRNRLQQALASGAAATSEAALGSSLSVLSATWLGQVNHATYISDRVARTSTLYHHQVGIAGYNNASYVDLPGNLISVVSQEANTSKEAAVFFNSAMHASVFESTAVQQTTGTPAVSTVKLIDQAVANGLRIYDGKAANFASAVQPNLVGCASLIPSLQADINAGYRLILPARCDLQEGTWKGAGYFTVLANGTNYGMGAMISGGLLGGFSSLPLTPPLTVNNTFSQTPSSTFLQPVTGAQLGDPIDMTRGTYLYDHEDIMVGTGAFPASLSFARSYSSGTRRQGGPLGLGWTHNLTGSVSVGSDGFQAMGEDSGLDAVGVIAEKLVSLDLLTDVNKPLRNMVISTLATRWFSDQTINNTVLVNSGLNSDVFVKLPNGAYNAPQGKSSRLLLNADGTYAVETGNKTVMAFNAAGKLATITDPTGVQAKYSYSGNDLTQVSNSFGRTLTLGYSGGRIASVSDGTRSVAFTYDAAGNLETFKNANLDTTTFKYDLPGRITQVFYPSNPTVPFLTNVYDSLDRVQTQTDARGKLFTYYFAGTRSEEIGPLGKSNAYYVDANGKILKAIDPLGRATVNTYDGHSRLTRTTKPQGNYVVYEYDDASCAGAASMCTHNVKTIREVPKSGSGLPTLVSSFTYEGSFNKLASYTDPLLNTTNYTYTAQGNPLTVSAPADAQGERPVTTYGYTAYTVSGYPSFYLQTSETHKITATESTVNTQSYDVNNKYVPKTVVTDAGTGKLNLTTSFVYDAVGNLVQVDGPRSDVSDIIRTVYDAERRVVQVTDAVGKISRTGYDADGRRIRSASQIGSEWLVSCQSYSTSGKVLRNWGPARTAADTICPSATAPVSVTDFGYDDLDRLVTTVDQLAAGEGGSRTIETAYNLDDTVKSVKRGVGSAAPVTDVTYTYTTHGLVATAKDGRNFMTTYQYDGHDRKVKIQHPNPASPNVSSTSDVESFAYDANGHMISHVQRNGQTVTNVYDNLGRVIARNYPNTADNIVFGYDLLSRRTSARLADGSHEVLSVADNAGRYTSVTAGGKTLSYQYDAANNQVRMTWPEAAPFYVTREYDAANRLSAIKEMGTVSLASYTYDDLSRRAMATFGNGTSTSVGYSNQGLTSSMEHNLGGTTHDVAWTYGRNQAGDIAAHGWNNDLYQWNGYANGTRAYTANGLNQYTAVGGVAQSYDANGNLTGDGVWTYAYNTSNALVSANKAGVAANLQYDALGRLRRTVINADTRDLLYSGTSLAAEYDGAGALLRRHVFGAVDGEPMVTYEGASTAAKQWLHADHLGSVVARTDATGNAIAVHTYGPYGEPGGAAPVRFGYTGQQYLDELELSYYNARFYSPALGRFLQTDPVGKIDDRNQYAYVGNNPLNANDPQGAWVTHVIGGLFNAGVGLAASWYTGERDKTKLIVNFGVDFIVGVGTSGRAGIAQVNRLKAAMNSSVGKGGVAVTGEVVKGKLWGSTNSQIGLNAGVAGALAATGVAGKYGAMVAKHTGAVVEGFTPVKNVAALLQRPAQKGTPEELAAAITEGYAARISLPALTATSHYSNTLAPPTGSAAAAAPVSGPPKK
jgi:RHS repeat-associated protein